MVIAIKFFDDEYYLNLIYAKIGGITAGELAFLETNFLKMMGYNLMVKKQTFSNFYKEMSRNYNKLTKVKPYEGFK